MTQPSPRTDPKRCRRCGHLLEGGECPRCPGGAIEARDAGPISDFFHGVGLFFRGAAWVFGKPRYWHYVVIPFLLNCLVFGGLLYLVFWGLHAQLSTWLEGSAAWGWLYYVAMVGAAAIALVVLFYTFALAGTVVAAPFTDFLSEKLEAEVLAGYTPPPFGWKRFVREMAHALWEAIKLLAVELVAITVLLAIGLVPVMGWAIALVGFSLIAAVDFVDVVLARKMYGLGEKTRFVSRHKARMLGFGVVSYVVMAIPVVNFLFIPAGVAGGTLLYVEASNK